MTNAQLQEILERFKGIGEVLRHDADLIARVAASSRDMGAKALLFMLKDRLNHLARELIQSCDVVEIRINENLQTND
jgi:hypothetical protein